MKNKQIHEAVINIVGKTIRENGRKTQRTLGYADVIGAVGRLARGEPYAVWTSGRHAVPRSYGYPADYVAGDVVATPDTIGWAIGRMGCGSSTPLCISRVSDRYGPEAIRTEAVVSATMPGVHTLPRRSAARLTGPCDMPGATYGIRRETRRRSWREWEAVDLYSVSGEGVGVAWRVRPLPGSRSCWEHAASEAAAREEYARKVLLHEARERDRLARERADYAARRERQRAERNERLLARIGTRLMATYDDARAVGHCVAGIEAWCAQRGLAIDQRVSVATLMRDDDHRARSVALFVARRALQAARS